ncbi:MAG: biotin/lipoyl-binding protein [Bacteroidetes bacterium]|nr:MAG: biotin/lipoyl-binding protein [Bacteroidota bacterium]
MDQRIVRIRAHEFEFDSAFLERLSEFDMLETAPGRFHVIHQTRTFGVEVERADLNGKVLALKVNGQPWEVRLEDRHDGLIAQMGLNSAAGQKVSDVKAPMPGLVLSVRVSPQQAVKKGDPLLVLEAMKMENVLKSPGDGMVKAVHVSQGKAVEKGQLLIELE